MHCFRTTSNMSKRVQHLSQHCSLQSLGQNMMTSFHYVMPPATLQGCLTWSCRLLNAPDLSRRQYSLGMLAKSVPAPSRSLVNKQQGTFGQLWSSRHLSSEFELVPAVITTCLPTNCIPQHHRLMMSKLCHIYSHNFNRRTEGTSRIFFQGISSSVSNSRVYASTCDTYCMWQVGNAVGG
jgi:hypothetical protein